MKAATDKRQARPLIRIAAVTLARHGDEADAAAAERGAVRPRPRSNLGGGEVDRLATYLGELPIGAKIGPGIWFAANREFFDDRIELDQPRRGVEPGPRIRPIDDVESAALAMGKIDHTAGVGVESVRRGRNVAAAGERC